MTTSIPLRLKEKNHHLFNNSFYRIETDQEGNLIFCNRDGKPLVSELTYQRRSATGQNGPLFEQFDWTFGKETIHLVAESQELQLTLQFHMESNNPKLTIETLTCYRAACSIEHESLCFVFTQPVTEIYKKNRKRQSRFLQKLYWLDKQGVKFGRTSSCAFIYHTPELSSLRLETQTGRLFAQLDDAADHPHIGPHKDKLYTDRSAAHYQAGASRGSRFNLYLGAEPTLFPRLMLHPQGHLATYVWTEHACYSDFRLHKALYFGSEHISKPSQAVAGFVKHRIPVTKSVFYANSQSAKNDCQSNHFTGPMVAIQKNPAFENYLQELHRLGLYEICLHCPQPISSSKELIAEAVAYMKKQFDTVTWIDHIWMKPAGKGAGCQEGFSYAGVLDGPFDMRTLWAQHKTQYFWSCCFEYMHSNKPSLYSLCKKGSIQTLFQEISRRLKRNLLHRLSVLDLFYTSHGTEETPTPLYWRHPTLYPQLIAWPTKKAYHILKKEKRHTPSQVQKLIRNWGVCFTHGYPVYVGDINAAWTFDEQGTLVISKPFDQLLEQLAALRDQGHLHLAQLRQVLDYWQQLENVSLEYHWDEDAVTIKNGNATQIQGLSLAVNRPDIQVDGKCPLSRRCGSDTIIWFDLPGNGEVKLIPK